ncbi:diaminobutyrate acetyltransferase [Pseudactinotalea sp. HY160]|uniref:diaminobutyrate acetyltransferase n=1 Tax=Pseudactinotalea sp. HY160 TaxID=2654490 RepID=UPI00128C33B9|nr:diaminobutyrate acetyltransferase [Pseudactinotalea sp. HY160]MPV48623.1 diaminobutyrate acetyltransferase [Pseudactinotalea sp. HY160]
MPDISADPVTDPDPTVPSPPEFRSPTLADGSPMWRLARDTGVLDLNSSYAYLLWCRDFAQTSVVAVIDGAFAGFITGYLRPDAPGTLMIWQVATDARFRGRGLAKGMLDHLVEATRPDRLETTITADNTASISLFTGFADRRGATCSRTALFTPEHYPDSHETEYLFEIGPLS